MDPYQFTDGLHLCFLTNEALLRILNEGFVLETFLNFAEFESDESFLSWLQASSPLLLLSFRRRLPLVMSRFLVRR